MLSRGHNAETTKEFLMSTEPGKEEPGFEERMRRLEEIVRELENPELPLERSVELYKEGRAVSQSCRELLEKARHSVLLCDGEGETPFTDMCAKK